jgi:hypothetical protein
MPRQRRARADETRDRTPLTLRSGVPLDAATRAQIEAQVRSALASLDAPITRATVRFEDVGGRRGGIDTRCHIELVFDGGARVVDEERGESAPMAAARTLMRLSRMARREVQRLFRRSPIEVDTSAPGVSETDRKRGPASLTGRGTKARPESAVYALEDTSDGPSRKSTRGSSNRIKAAAQLTRRTKRAVTSPQARAARAR